MIGIEAVIVDTPAARMRAWLIEAFDTAPSAKQMIRLLAAELVAGLSVAARKQCELLVRNNQVQKPGPRANRTVAVEQFR